MQIDFICIYKFSPACYNLATLPNIGTIILVENQIRVKPTSFFIKVIMMKFKSQNITHFS